MTDHEMVVTVPLTIGTSLTTQVAVFLESIVLISGASFVIVPTFQSPPSSESQPLDSYSSRAPEGQPRLWPWPATPTAVGVTPQQWQ